LGLVQKCFKIIRLNTAKRTTDW